MISIIEFAIYVALVAMLVKFAITLAEKWDILPWLQAHAPNKFFFKLFSCNFCQSFWLGMIVCVFLAIFVDWRLIFVPFFSSTLR